MSDENLVAELQRLSAIGEAKRIEKEEKALTAYLKLEFEKIKNLCYAAASNGKTSISVSDKRDSKNSAVDNISSYVIGLRLLNLLQGMGFNVVHKNSGNGAFSIYSYTVSW